MSTRIGKMPSLGTGPGRGFTPALGLCAGHLSCALRLLAARVFRNLERSRTRQFRKRSTLPFNLQARLRCLTVVLSTLASGRSILCAQPPFEPVIPKTWNESELADWATPLAGINRRPEHMSPDQYYGLPEDNLKTWPVYLAGKEPPGYWEMLQHVGPKPMIEPGKLRTGADWVEAGRSVFMQIDHLHLRTTDPALIAMARRGDYLVPLPDGTAANVRWVPTPDGVALGFPNCAACHRMITPDDHVIDGAPSFALPGRRTGPPGPAIVARSHRLQRYVDGGSPVHMAPGPFGMWLYSAFGVPWLQDDVHTKLKGMSQTEFSKLVAAGVRGGAVPRWNGSIYFPTKGSRPHRHQRSQIY